MILFRPSTPRACALLLALLAHTSQAQTNVSTTLGLTTDEDSNAGVFGGLDLLFANADWLSASLGINRPTEGFEDSRTLTAALDYGHVFDAVSLTAGIGYGDREGFTRQQFRAGLQWQSDTVLLGALLEENRIEATSYISSLRGVREFDEDFSVSGAGLRFGLYGASGMSFNLSFIAYDEPSGLRFHDVDQLSARLLAAEIDRLVSDGRRIDPARIDNRLAQLPRSYSNATSVLSDTLGLSLSLPRGVHEFGMDFYRDTYALVDADMTTWDLRWMFPLWGPDNQLELWAGSGDLEGSRSAFGGLRFIFYR